MGEAFMKSSRPEQACERFITELKEFNVTKINEVNI